MRTDLILELARAVEASPERGHRFDMGFWGNEALAKGASCGTAGCMGGIAAQIWPDRLSLDFEGQFVSLRDPDGRHSFEALAHILEIPVEDALGLFSFKFGLELQNHDAAYHANRLREYVRRKLDEDAK